MKNNPELFLSIPMSYGTLGFLTAVDLDIVPYKPYIELSYTRTQTLDEFEMELKDACYDPNVDSVEGIMFSLDKSIIMRGRFVDCIPKSGVKNNIGRWFKPWFHTHVQTFLNAPSKTNMEYLPTRVNRKSILTLVSSKFGKLNECLSF